MTNFEKAKLRDERMIKSGWVTKDFAMDFIGVKLTKFNELMKDPEWPVEYREKRFTNRYEFNYKTLLEYVGDSE